MVPGASSPGPVAVNDRSGIRRAVATRQHRRRTHAAERDDASTGDTAPPGGASGLIETAADQRQAIISAFQAARSAIGALDDHATDADIAAAARLIEAARTAVAAAKALAESEREAHENAVSAIEDNLENARARIKTARDARRQTRAEEATKIRTAITGARITNVAAAVEHEAAPVMSGTVSGTPAVAVADLKTAAVGGGATVEGWSRGHYGAADEDGGTEDTIALYTNIEAPGTRPFSGEGGKYSASNGLDAEGNLPIVAATDATLVVSADFPDGPGIETHEADAEGIAQVTGSFDGAPGTYVCTPMANSACRSSIKHGGGIDLTVGDAGWKFVPDPGATVPTADSEYQYFGWWRRDTDGSYAVGSFHHGVGGAVDEFADLPKLQGPATYTGPAAGLFAIIPQPGDASAGDFTATVTLEADFGDVTNPGTIEGTVDAFMVNGRAMDWSVDLQAARIGAQGAITSGGNATALTYWTVGDTKAETTGTWSGQFHDADDVRTTPVVATGRFEAFHGTIGRMIGAFGARQQ